MIRRPAIEWPLLTALVLLLPSFVRAAEPQPIRVLFLGDQGHHRPAERFAQLQPVLAARGIELTYTETLDDLAAGSLARFDGLIVYANIERISREQERALLDFVAGGKGFIPIHCASYCFLNSDRYIELVGAQFQRHGTGVFRTTVAEPQHPLMRGFEGFESWDETYVHQRHNEKDRVVLEFRPDEGGREPWTWVRTHGKGRVFYTAWGHDERTWGHGGFQNLLERGIRWAVGADPGEVPAFAERPRMTEPRTDVAPFEYVEAEIPFYPAGERWGTVGEPIHQMQLPLVAEESLKHFVTPVDFEVRLFASEPDIGKPIDMNWDAAGRLWIAETADYPNDLQPEGQGNDRIRICEDTDGDGRADRFTVFCDKLSIPTSLAFAQGGVIVHQAPHTLFFKDTDGDDVADERHVLFTGWSTADTHAGPSNMQYGLDNWIWGMVGYAGFEGHVGGERHSFQTGFYRFRPDGSKMEFVRNTDNNSWGVGISEEGLVFGSTANGNPSVHVPIANRYYESVRGWSSSVLPPIADSARFYPITDNVRQVDHHGNFTAAAGHALYTARAYPREYWNRAAFVNGPTGHLTATFLIEAAGSGFRSKNAWNLVASDDQWSAPIMAEVGPDGHVWIIDWYNYIVQHNPTPAGHKTGKGNAYESELRDKKHGRVYRVVYTKAPADEPISLAGAAPERLVSALGHGNMFWRRHAQRLLVERGGLDVLPGLARIAAERSVDEIGLNAAAIHALWTMHGLGALDGANDQATAAAVAALEHRSAGVRRAAVSVLPRTAESIDVVLSSRLLDDQNPQVRMAALLALAEMPFSRPAAEAVAGLLHSRSAATDRWMLDAATSAAAAHDLAFLKAMAAGPALAAAAEPQARPGDEPRGGPRNRMRRPTPLGVVTTVAEHYARGGPADTVGSLVSDLTGAPSSMTEAIVEGLALGWPADRPAPLEQADEESLAALFKRLSPAAQGRLVTLAARWGSSILETQAAEIRQSFLAMAADDEQPEQARMEAAAQLIELARADADAVNELLGLVTPRTSPELAAGLLEAVGRSQAAEAGEALVESLARLTPAGRPAALRILLSRTDWTESLVGAAEQGTLELAELSLDQRQGLIAHPQASIAARAKELLSKGGGLPSPDREKVLDELMPLTQQRGDPLAGKQVFVKQCAKCHVHGGEGTQVGPDLTGMAVHPKAELLTQIIDPSRSVEGNYRVYTVVTADGRVFAGLLASETKTSVELFDAEGKKQVLVRDEIEELAASSKSLMPEGFEKQVTPDELVDLLEFLAQRGKYLPIPLTRSATIASTQGMFYSEQAIAERLVFDDWSAKTFQGIPFQLIDPQGGRVPNVVLLYGPHGKFPPTMPRAVSLPCNAPAKAVHLLSGVSGWGHPLGEKGSVSLIVRLHYDDGRTEDHPLKNGEHFADYIRRVDVPGSAFAFPLRGQQIRYLAVHPERPGVIREIELVKGPDDTAPVVMAVTVEVRE
ncbi:MAG: PVC-type heme-binding CxxCH protein [Pirellulales bacterium]